MENQPLSKIGKVHRLIHSYTNQSLAKSKVHSTDKIQSTISHIRVAFNTIRTQSKTKSIIIASRNF